MFQVVVRAKGFWRCVDHKVVTDNPREHALNNPSEASRCTFLLLASVLDSTGVYTRFRSGSNWMQHG